MLKLLLKKEWRETYRSDLSQIKKNPFSSIMNGVIIASLVAALLLIFVLLNKRFETFGVSLPLYIISLFILVIVQMIIHLPKFKKMVFNPSDKQIINVLPIKRKTLITSKMILFYIEELISLSFLVIPLTVAYGLTNNVNGSFYLVLLPLILVLPIFVLTLSLLFVYPYYYAVEYLKNKYFIQFALIIALIGTAAFGYKSILEVFISLINEDRLTYLFNVRNATLIENISKFLVPCNWIIGLSNGKLINILYIISSSAFCLAVCYLLSDKLYNIKIRFNKPVLKEKLNKVTTPTKSLIKKEYILMFRSTNYLFSYGSLLVLLPVIVNIVTIAIRPLVIRLLGDAFFLPFVILFVTMFSAVINSFGGLFISREKDSISIIKMLPVSFKKQMNIKVGISLVNAGLSILVTMISMLLLKVVDFKGMICIFVISMLLVGVLIVSLAKKDLNKPAYKNEESNLSMAIVFSLLIPVGLFIGSLFLIMQFSADQMYLILIGVMLLMFIVLFILYNSSIEKNFRKLRVE